MLYFLTEKNDSLPKMENFNLHLCVLIKFKIVYKNKILAKSFFKLFMKTAFAVNHFVSFLYT